MHECARKYLDMNFKKNILAFSKKMVYNGENDGQEGTDDGREKDAVVDP